MKKILFLLGIIIVVGCASPPAELLSEEEMEQALSGTLTAMSQQLEQPVIAPTQTSEPAPTQAPTATPTELLPLVLETVCLPQETQRETARVTKVIDGDTIEVEIDGQSYPVRYIGMDTPENTSQVEYYGYEALRRNRDLVFGKKVTMVKDVSETDQYGRLLRYVLVGDTFVNYALIAEGYAEAVTYPPDTACEEAFREAERLPKATGLVLWGPIPILSPPTAPPATVPPPPAATSPPAAPTQPPASGNCDPAYPDPGVCIPPRPPDLDCKDIPFRRFTVLPPDPHGFDGDNDGIGCESN